jgi:hypothetical protein
MYTPRFFAGDSSIDLLVAAIEERPVLRVCIPQIANKAKLVVHAQSSTLHLEI